MSLAIHQKDLKIFVDDLIKDWPVFGPVRDKNAITSKFRFQKIDNFSDLDLNYGETVIPPKKYLLPSTEKLFSFKNNQLKPSESNISVVFGLNKKDGEGIFYLDKIMSEPEIDETYIKRRKSFKFIVFSHLPPSNNLNCDLYLQKTEKDHYLVFPFSDFGERLVKKSYFVHEGDVGSLSVRHLPDEVIYHPRLDEIVEKSKNHPIWDKLAETCFNCGICTYVCPLCYCFETEDRVDITKDIKNDCSGCRYKRWDSCMLPDFAKVTFHNFRPETKDRIYNWYYHKFVRMPREYGFPGCIDCGRCITYCPAKINYREVLKELINDAKIKK